MENCDFSNHEELQCHVDTIFEESDALVFRAFSRILELIREEQE